MSVKRIVQSSGKARRIFGAAAAASLAVLLVGGGSAMAQSYGMMSCSELWYARNAIYADKGYCFQTERAMRTFGRACFPPYGQLSPIEQREVNAIKTWERRNGCS